MRVLNAEALTSHGNVRARRTVVDILEAGLQAADPYANTARLIRVEGDRLIVGGDEFEPPGSPQRGTQVHDLNRIRRILVFGAGKGVQHVAKAIEDALGERLSGGHVIDKHGHPLILQRIGVTLGAHPVPDEGCVRGCQEILRLAQGLTADDLVFTIACNGVSALLTLPVPGVSLEDVRRTTYLMQIDRGAPTGDLNPVRNHLDVMKGGRISRYIQPAQAVHLFSSNVLYSHEWLMRENVWLHNFPEGSTFADAVAMLHKWQAWEQVPQSVRDWLSRADPQYETVKAAEFERTRFRAFAVSPPHNGPLESARRRARELGLTPHVLANFLTAEAREAGFVAATIARDIEERGEPFRPPCALLSGGELLVTVGGESGVGGRNQEYSLAAALRLAGSRNIALGAVDTDGTDGPGLQFHSADLGGVECLAGAVVDGDTAAQAKEMGVDIHDVLRRHDASPALVKLRSGVVAERNVSLTDLAVTVIHEEFK